MATNTTATATNHTGNGSTNSFAISFPFLANNEIDVTVAGVLKTLDTHYTISGSTVTFTSGNTPANGAAIKFQRNTNISTKKVDFTDGSVLTETDLDTNSDQVLFAQQEITDKLSGIEEGATADQTNAEIKTAYEANSDTNAFTDALQTKLNNIESNATADQTNAEIRAAVEAASDSNVFTDNDHTKLNNIEDNATADQTASEIKSLIASSPLDASHLGANSVDTSELADNAVTNAKIADSELKTLATMQSGTASKLADTTTLTSDIADLNQLDGMQKATTITDDDTKFPTSGAIVDYVAAQLAPIGGLEAIANESSFPNTQPASGVVISIADAGGMAVASDGTASGQTVGGTTVNISGIATNFRGSSVSAGVRFLVVSTGAGQNYTYHKATLKEDDLVGLSGDINDFGERYRVGSSFPTTNNDSGDLFWHTTLEKLYVYNGGTSAFEETQSIGNFFISTLSPAFDGSTTNFTITNAPTSAQQILLIVEGVLQKPNSGTSTPTEGFALDGSTIKLAAAPAIGASYHAVVMGSAVNTGTPSNDSVTTAILQNNSVSTQKIQDEAITLAKLEHGTSSNNGKFLRANNGADPSFETIDLTALSASNLTSGTVPDARFPATLPAASAANLTNLPAANITGDLPAISAANLTNIPAGNLTGTVADARISALTASKLTGALPAISGASLTDLPASGKPTNLVINGAMRLAQRGTYSAGEGYKTVDRFQYYKSGTNETPNQSQVDVASGTPAYQAGFRKAYQIQNGNQTSAGGGDLVFIEQNIEARNIRNSGWNYTDSNSKITLSFWVKSSVAQNFYGQLVSTDGTSQNYPFETGTLSANTWTKVTKTIPGNSNLQFDDDSNRGLQIIWWPFLGTSYTDSGVSLNSWGAWASGTRTPESTSTWYMTNDSTFQLTGVLLEVGDTASDFPFESPDDTLRKCKRYCHVISKSGYSLLGIGMQYYSGTIFIDGGPIDMRATPTMVAKSGVSGAYVYEKVFGNSAEYTHYIGLDGKTTSEHAVFNMVGTASRHGEAVRCSAHAASLSNNEPFVYLTAEI